MSANGCGPGCWASGATLGMVQPHLRSTSPPPGGWHNHFMAARDFALLLCECVYATWTDVWLRTHAADIKTALFTQFLL